MCFPVCVHTYLGVSGQVSGVWHCRGGEAELINEHLFRV